GGRAALDRERLAVGRDRHLTDAIRQRGDHVGVRQLGGFGFLSRVAARANDLARRTQRFVHIEAGDDVTALRFAEAFRVIPFFLVLLALRASLRLHGGEEDRR